VAYPVKVFLIVGIEDTERGVTQPNRVFEHRVEHRPYVAGEPLDTSTRPAVAASRCSGSSCSVCTLPVIIA
jgi:hypothetical protein